MDCGRLQPPRVVPLPGAARRVALEVLLNGPKSRKEISERLNLNPGHVTRITQNLVELGLMSEKDADGPSKVGRPSIPLEIRPVGFNFVGIKFAPGALHAVVCDLAANVVAERNWQIASDNPEVFVSATSRLIQEFKEFSPVAIGITLGGQTQDAWTVSVAPILGWVQVPLGQMIENQTGLPTVISNDMIAITAAQHWFGHGKGLSSFAVLTIGAGVGYGLVSNDQIVTNSDMGLGLIGHEAVRNRCSRCGEGQNESAASILTIPAIEAAVTALVGRDVEFREVLHMYSSGHPAAKTVVSEAAEVIAVLIQRIITFAMPEKIVVSGEGVALAERAWEQITRSINNHRPTGARALNLTLQHIQEKEWARGAAVTAIQLSMESSNVD